MLEIGGVLVGLCVIVWLAVRRLRDRRKYRRLAALRFGARRWSGDDEMRELTERYLVQLRSGEGS